MASAMVNCGHEAFVLAAGAWTEGKQYFAGYRDTVYRGIRIRRLDINWRLAPEPFKYLYDNPVTARQLENYLQQVRPDIVHMMSTYTLSASVIAIAKKYGCPVILTMLDYWFICPRLSLLRSDGSLCDGHVPARQCLRCMAWNAKIYRWPRKVLPERMVLSGLGLIAKIPVLTGMRGLVGMVGNYDERRAAVNDALATVDRIILPSQFMYSLLVGHGVQAGKLKVIGLGISTEGYSGHPLRTDCDDLRIGFLGQLIHSKGVHILVEAFNQLQEGLFLPGVQFFLPSHLSGALMPQKIAQLLTHRAREW